MAYTINVTGTKSDVIAIARQQASSQSAGLPNQEERDTLEKAITDAEEVVNRFAGENDSISLTISGHMSQTDTALASDRRVGISISRASDRRRPIAETVEAEDAGTQESPAATRSAAPRI